MIKKYIEPATYSIVVIVLIGGMMGLAYLSYTKVQQMHQQPQTDTQTPNTCGEFATLNNNSKGIGVGAILSDGERVGLSDGTLAFDIRPSSYVGLKCTGTQDFNRCLQSSNLTDCKHAESSLTTEVENVPDDAEALIYRQNVRIWRGQDGFPFTLIVGVSFSKSNRTSSRYLLQGVYAEQEEFNRTHAHVKLRVLIANFGDSATSATPVVRQIIAAISADRSIVGIINIPFFASLDSQFMFAIQQLASLNIPVVFPTGAVGSSNEQYPTMFHIAPSVWQEGSTGATFAQNILKVHRIIVFVDQNDLYSRNLACSFLEQFEYNRNISSGCDQQLLINTCGSICYYYASGSDANAMAPLASSALKSSPQLIYFAGDASDAESLLQGLQNKQNNPQFQQLPGLRLMGGDALYQPVYGTNYPRLAFTAFAFPDEWEAVNSLKPEQLEPVNSLKPEQSLLLQVQAPFFDEYALDFQGQLWPPPVYGFIRPDSDAILSYDATGLLLQSIEKASNDGQIPNITPPNVLQVVQKIQFQGFSGYIHFDTQGNPMQKTMVFLVVNEKSLTQMRGIDGCFSSLPGYCFHFKAT